MLDLPSSLHQPLPPHITPLASVGFLPLALLWEETNKQEVGQSTYIPDSVSVHEIRGLLKNLSGSDVA